MTRATKTKKREHVVWIPPSTLACLHCGSHYEVNMPALVDIVISASQVFEKAHNKCKKTARGLACAFCFEFGHVELDCPLTKYGGDWQKWREGPDTGASSLTLCRKLAGATFLIDQLLDGPRIPYDGDDFGRCHRLLRAIPGWRGRIGEMRDVPGWAPLVDAWDELETLYEQELPTGRAPKLYARMRALRGEPL